VRAIVSVWPWYENEANHKLDPMASLDSAYYAGISVMVADGNVSPTIASAVIPRRGIPMASSYR